MSVKDRNLVQKYLKTFMGIVLKVFTYLVSLRLLIDLILTLQFFLLKRNKNHNVQCFMIGLKGKK